MPPATDQSLMPVLLSTADEDKYKVYSRLEINAILGSLQKAGTLVTAYFGASNDFILTCILRVSAEENLVVLDYGADPATNQRALKATGFTFVAAHDRVKVQFTAETLKKTRFDDREAFAVKTPTSLLRLQRREFFRIVTPLSRPLKCVIPPQKTKDAEGNEVKAPAEATVADISCGGVALIGFNADAKVESGMLLKNCMLQLPDEAAVTADLLIKSTYEVTLRSGSKQLHAGCEFVKMPERVRATIQRYINAMERERRKGAVGG